MKEPVALLAVSQRGVDFKAKDERPVYLFFLFLTPRKETTLHLQILSRAAALFADKHTYHSDSGVIYLTATTMSLAGIVATQIGNVLACRTERESVFKVGFFKNKLILLGIASEVIIITTLVYTPFLQRIFGLAPLGLKEWGFLFVFTPILLLIEEGRKWIIRKRRKAFSKSSLSSIKLPLPRSIRL